MRKVSSRSLAVLLLAILVLAGLGVFTVQYLFSAGRWVTFPGSPHVYTGNNLTTGRVQDRTGTLLLEGTEDGRAYSPDETVRKATLHILGDRYGYISSPVLTAYAAQMAGFSPVQGIYDSQGGEMTLTLSAAANTTAYEMLAGRAGCVAVYNYRTGEILCLASGPSYDPDHMPDIENDTSGQYDGVYVNRPIAASYTPGSIFKLVTATAALESIPDILQRSFTCNGVTQIGGLDVHCLNVHGTISFADALAKSCNVAFGELAVELGAQTLSDCAAKLGITSRVSFDGLTTAAGQFAADDSNAWELAWAGIGQSTDLVNPVQYMTLMGAIANGGRAAQPYLVAAAGSYRAETTLMDACIDAATAEQLAALMVNNVQTVYGSWNFPVQTVGAKSGTAEQAQGASNALFAGFVQSEVYPLAFVAVVEQGGAGSEACIPVVSAVLSACMQAMEHE